MPSLSLNLLQRVKARSRRQILQVEAESGARAAGPIVVAADKKVRDARPHRCPRLTVGGSGGGSC